MLQARCQPAGLLRAVEKARGAVAKGAAAPATKSTARSKRLADLATAVNEFEQVEDRRAAVAGRAYQSDTGGAAAGVELDAHRLEFAGCRVPVDEADNEGRQPVHACAAALEHQPRALLRAGHQGPAATIQNEHRHIGLLKQELLPRTARRGCPYGPGDAHLAVCLPSGKLQRSVESINSALSGDGPFRGYPDRVCRHRFQSAALRKYAAVGLLTSLQRSGLDTASPGQPQAVSSQ